MRSRVFTVFALAAMAAGGLGADVLPSSRLAAEEFTNYVAKVTGRTDCDANAKGHNRREMLNPDATGETFVLTDEMRTFTGEYEVPADEWDSIVLQAAGGTAILDDVSVVPLK